MSVGWLVRPSVGWSVGRFDIILLLCFCIFFNILNIVKYVKKMMIMFEGHATVGSWPSFTIKTLMDRQQMDIEAYSKLQVSEQSWIATKDCLLACLSR